MINFIQISIINTHIRTHTEKLIFLLHLVIHMIIEITPSFFRLGNWWGETILLLIMILQAWNRNLSSSIGYMSEHDHRINALHLPLRETCVEGDTYNWSISYKYPLFMIQTLYLDWEYAWSANEKDLKKYLIEKTDWQAKFELKLI